MLHRGTSPSASAAFDRSKHGLRLVGYPVVLKCANHRLSLHLQLLFLVHLTNLSADKVVLWSCPLANPDGEQLLASALSQEEGRPT